MNAALHPSLKRLLDEYTASHRHPVNRLTHKIAIPLIVFHVLAMLDWLKLGPSLQTTLTVPFDVLTLSVGHVAWALAVAYYARLHLPLAAAMAVLTALCFPLGMLAPRPLVVIVAVVGWGVQLAGHSVWEKNRPAFLKNMQQALIGPLFFLATATGAYRPAYEAPAADAATAAS